MLFKLSEVYGLTRSLPKITSKELPIKISYNLFKLLKKCSEEMETLEKARIKLVEKYADKKESKEEGNKDVKVADENKPKFQKEFENLLKEEIEIDFKKISLCDFGDISLSANDIAPLEKIIKEK